MILLAVVAIATAGCMARGDKRMDDSLERYRQALVDFPGHVDGIERGLERFARAYADLTAPEISQLMAELYAERLFFNDTIHTFEDRDSLAGYMGKTGASLDSSVISIDQIIRDQDDVFVRWTMEFKTRAAGRDIHSRSIGVSHLRFNADGEVVLHQDFWDSGHALYAHLPLVGFAVRRARARL
ncbi:MAG: nuclear transport factor 2 family protein [Wenzhouxiangella sp.]|nr:nuclear transport factor 2 family protein [Wenzhouxiangella sp.]